MARLDYTSSKSVIDLPASYVEKYASLASDPLKIRVWFSFLSQVFCVGSADKDEFLREAQLMKRLRHPRLVQLYAVCSRTDPIYIVTELMCNGALNSYLQGNLLI